MLKPLCILTIVLASPLVNADIFKCTREEGNTVYQNFPCSIDSIGSTATAAPPKEEPAAPAVAKPPAQVASGPIVEPRIGLTVKQMKNSTWGQPLDIVKEEVVDGWTQTWIWDKERKRTVIFDVRGRVSEITQ